MKRSKAAATESATQGPLTIRLRHFSVDNGAGDVSANRPGHEINGVRIQQHELLFSLLTRQHREKRIQPPHKARRVVQLTAFGQCEKGSASNSGIKGIRS